MGVSVENGYYGSVRAEAMMAEAVRFYVVPSGSFWFYVVGGKCVDWRWLERVKDA